MRWNCAIESRPSLLTISWQASIEQWVFSAKNMTKLLFLRTSTFTIDLFPYWTVKLCRKNSLHTDMHFNKLTMTGEGREKSSFKNFRWRASSALTCTRIYIHNSRYFAFYLALGLLLCFIALNLFKCRLNFELKLNQVQKRYAPKKSHFFCNSSYCNIDR